MSLLPPFFGKLMAYDGKATIAFDCPGHQGGQFYRKSPAGQLFFKHFGEAIFRNDLCNADVELGDLLIHEGAANDAQRHAAMVFGADQHLLRAQRHQHLEQGGHRRAAQARRPGAVRPQQPQVAAPGRAGAGRRDPGLPADGAQPLRHDRRGRLGRLGRGLRCASASATTRWSRTSRAPMRRGRSAWPASSSRTYDGTVYNVRKVLETHRPPVRLRAVGRGLDRLQRLPSAVRRPQPDAAEGPGARHAGAVLDAVGAQAGRRLLAGQPDPQARRAPARAEALRRPQALQRVVPAARLDLAVLPAVRVARRQRQDPRGQGRRDAVGPLHRARHRDAQEAARVRPALRAHRPRRAGAVVLRPLRARPGDGARARASPPTPSTCRGRACRPS